MMKVGIVVGLGVALVASVAMGQGNEKKMLGNWKAASGSILTVYGCGKEEVCVKLFDVNKPQGPLVDELNPDKALQGRSLCGLVIGRGFRMEDGTHAEGGKLYDPKSGKTYSGSMTLDGNELHARGYVGIKMFGRSETWTRSTAAAAHCK